MTGRRQAAERRGRRAERWAALWLGLKGWRTLDRRATTPFGELDLVARRGDVLIFVEVKARASRDAALFAITPRQRDRLVRAAAAWRSARPALAALEARFDLVAITPWRPPRHHPGVFVLDGPQEHALL